MLLWITCEQATLLVEKRADEALPIGARVAVAIHLSYCPYCQRYEAQSRLIGQLALFGAQRAARNDGQLSAAARGRIQQRLDAARGAA